MAKVKLNDVAIEARETWKQNKTDVPVVGLEHLEPDEIWLKRWDLNPDENTFTKGFKKGQLLFGRRRAYQKKMSVASCDGICSGDITVIAARPEKMLPELLPFYLRTDSFFDFAVRGSGGSLSPRVKWSHISDYEFDLPPMEEQKKLAELLWAANDLKEKYKKAITATDEMLKAKFREMFGDCEKRKLGEFVEIIRGVSYKPNEIIGANNEGIAVLRANNIFKGELVFDDLVYIKTNRVNDVQKIKKGDFIVCASNGSMRLVGKVAMAINDMPDFSFGSFCLLVRPISLDPKFLNGFFASDEYRKIIENVSSGTCINNLKPIIFERMEIPLPPLSLQREFVAIAEKAEEAKTALKKSIADIDQVMKGLING